MRRIIAAYVLCILGTALIMSTISSTPAVVTEDMPEWDCLTMGNRACVIRGHLVVNIDDMPTDPYERCEYLLGISARLGGIDYTPEVCAGVAENRG